MRSDLIHLLTEFEIGVPNVSAEQTIFSGDNNAIFSPSSKKCYRSGVCCYVVSLTQNRT